MTFKERAVAALEEHLKGTNGVVKATIMDCLTIVKQVPELDTNTFACTGEKCPVQCKDCSMFAPEEIRRQYNTEKYCMRTGWVVKDDDYCSYGEMKVNYAEMAEASVLQT